MGFAEVTASDWMSLVKANAHGLTVMLLAGSALSAFAQAPKWADKNHIVGTLVSLTPDPYTDLKAFVIKTSSKDRDKDQMSFAVSAGVHVPKGLKAGDIISVQYRTDQSGIFWADAVKKAGAGKPPPPAGH
jgi:hypothetical protein